MFLPCRLCRCFAYADGSLEGGGGVLGVWMSNFVPDPQTGDNLMVVVSELGPVWRPGFSHGAA